MSLILQLQLFELFNISRLIFEHLNIISFRKKLTFFVNKLKGALIFLVLLESNLDDRFSLGQTLIYGFHAPLRFDRDKNGRGIMLYIWKDIPATVSSQNFPSAENVFVEITLRKKKRLINCSYNRNENNIKNHVESVSRILDALSTKYENALFLSNFSACVDDETLEDFCSSYCLKSLIKQLKCFKNPKNLRCMDLILASKP